MSLGANASFTSSRCAPLAAAAVLLMTIPGASIEALAESRQLAELAFPLSVAPRMEVSFRLNASEHPWYLYVTGSEPGIEIKFWAHRDDRLEWGGRQAELRSSRLLDPGRWNLTFDTEGRIAIVHDLPGICGWQLTSTNLDQASCPALTLDEPTGFALTTWSIERPYMVRVRGTVEVHFFDEYLRPLGASSERRYETSMRGIVVIVPQSAPSVVTIDVEPAPPSDSVLPLVFLPAVAAIVVGLLAWRRQRRRKTNTDAETNK